MSLPPFGAPPLPSQTGNSGKYLTTNGSAASWGSVAAGGGQTLFEAIVATSGGDYTTLKAALDAGKTRIFIRNGTYTEAATGTNPLATTGIYIRGESPEGVVLTYTTTTQTFSGANFTMENLKLSFTTGGLTLSGAQSAIIGCHIANGGATNSAISMTGAKALFANNIYIDSTTAADPCLNFSGDNARIANNYFELNFPSGGTGINHSSKYGYVVGNTFKHVGGDNSCVIVFIANGAWVGTVTGNTFLGTLSTTVIGVVAAGGVGSVVSGNGFRNIFNPIKASASYATISGNHFATNDNNTSQILISGGSSSTVSGNTFNSNGTTGGIGIEITGGNQHTITGNRIDSYSTGISIASSARNNITIVGNNLIGCTTMISDSGTATTIADNVGMSILQEKHFVYMKNTSGGTINSGNVVIYKSVAAGDEITTTTSASDNKVFGVADGAISDTTYGYIQIRGKTTKLTADGTTDIAIGDFLTTFTSAGIVKKAAAGDQAIAIALEAFTTDASTGVLDALIITPRKL